MEGECATTVKHATEGHTNQHKDFIMKPTAYTFKRWTTAITASSFYTIRQHSLLI